MRFSLLRRDDGRVASRAHLLVLPSVVCANAVSRSIAKQVPGALAIAHQHGCAQVGDDAAETTVALEAVAGHPNAWVTLVVSLGCETLQGAGLRRTLDGRGLRAGFVGIQAEGGSTAAAATGATLLRDLAGPTAERSALELRPAVAVAHSDGAATAARTAAAQLDAAGFAVTGPVDVSRAPVLELVELTMAVGALCVVVVGDRLVPGPVLTPLLCVATGRHGGREEHDDHDLVAPTAAELVAAVVATVNGRTTLAEQRDEAAFALRRSLVTL